MTAPIASGWSESPGGPRTHWKAPPFHGARRFRSFTVRLPTFPIDPWVGTRWDCAGHSANSRRDDAYKAVPHRLDRDPQAHCKVHGYRLEACRSVTSALRDGHAVDLDIEWTGPLRDAEEDSGRRVLGKVAFVDLVEGLEALGGYAEHVALQHVIEVRPRRLQHCLHLFEDALGLALERRMLQELAGVRVEGRQAGHEHHVPSSGADRDGSAPFLKIGVERFDADDLSFHGLPPLSLGLFRLIWAGTQSELGTPQPQHSIMQVLARLSKPKTIIGARFLF